MKKVIAILVSVMMILTAMPAFADGATAAPASVDIYEALDNFSAQELATTYTSSTPYTTASGFKAPTTSGLEANVTNDDIDYVRISVPTDTTLYGGAVINDSNIKAGYGDEDDDVLEFSVTLRRNSGTSAFYFWLVDENGARETNDNIVKWWAPTSSRFDWFNGASTEPSGMTLADGVWYNITITIDFKNNLRILKIDGGDFDNAIVYEEIDDKLGDGVTRYSGMGVGYLSGVNAGDNYDVADMKISTSASSAYSSKLTFENGVFADKENASWKNGAWSVAAVSSIDRTIFFADYHHKNAVKLTPSSSDLMKFVHTFPQSAIGNEDTLIIEGSYFEHLFAQMRISVTGTDSEGTEKTVDVLNYSSANWNYSFCGAASKSMPKGNDEWRFVRAVLDFKNGDVALSTWAENDKDNSAKSTYDNDLTAANGFQTITSVTYSVWPRTWNDGRYMAIDDFRVYAADTLRLTETVPADGCGNLVSVTADPTLIFNMPVENYTGTMTLKDSNGNAVAGTVGLSAQRNGISFYPDTDLKPEETYTLTANCAVTDEFGSTVNVAKTITFTTEPVLTLVDFEFSKDEVTAGELGATIEVKAKDKLARDIYAALAIYNKVTGELVSINTGSINAVTNKFNLSATVPDAGEHYAKAFVWNTDANAVPYFTAQTIGLEQN